MPKGKPSLPPHTQKEWRDSVKWVIEEAKTDPESAHGLYDKLLEHFVLVCSVLDHSDRHLAKNTRDISAIANILMKVRDEREAGRIEFWYA